MRISDWSSDVCSSDLCAGWLAVSADRPDNRGALHRYRRCIGPCVRPYALLRLPLRAAPARHQAASFAPPSRPGSRPLACRHDGRTDRIRLSAEHTAALPSPMRTSSAVLSLKKIKYDVLRLIKH